MWKRLVYAISAVSLCLLLLVINQVRIGWVEGKLPHSVQPVGEITGETGYGELFRAQYPNLYRIDIQLASYNRVNTEPLIFHLVNMPAGQPAVSGQEVSIEVDAADIEDNQFHSFIFAPIAESTGRTYLFYLSAPNAVPGNAFTFWATPEENDSQGQIQIVRSQRSSPLPGLKHVVYRAYYRMSLSEAMLVTMDKVAENRPPPFNFAFGYVMLLFTLPLIAVLGSLAARSATRPRSVPARSNRISTKTAGNGSKNGRV